MKMKNENNKNKIKIYSLQFSVPVAVCGSAALRESLGRQQQQNRHKSKTGKERSFKEPPKSCNVETV